MYGNGDFITSYVVCPCCSSYTKYNYSNQGTLADAGLRSLRSAISSHFHVLQQRYSKSILSDKLRRAGLGSYMSLKSHEDTCNYYNLLLKL